MSSGRARIWIQVFDSRASFPTHLLKISHLFHERQAKSDLTIKLIKIAHMVWYYCAKLFLSHYCLYLLLIVSVHKEISRMLLPNCWPWLFSGDRICGIFVGLYFWLLFLFSSLNFLCSLSFYDEHVLFLSFSMALLRYHLYTLKFTHFKRILERILGYWQTWTTITAI